MEDDSFGPKLIDSECYFDFLTVDHEVDRELVLVIDSAGAVKYAVMVRLSAGKQERKETNVNCNCYRD